MAQRSNDAARSILLVEDDELMRLSLEDRLRIEGLDVVTATTVEGACLLLVHGGRPSLVVTDMRLPDGMGDRVFETCRERHPGVPVIVMTAFGSVSDAVRLVKGGALDYIEKPFDLDEFVDMVRVTIASGHSVDRGLRGSVEEAERAAIVEALESHEWAISRTADALGISRKNLWGKMRRYEIRRQV